MKFNIKMIQLVKDNSQPFSVTRKQNGSINEDGSYDGGQEITFLSNFMVTTAKKEDVNLLNIGNTSYQLVKIRQMKDDTNLIKENDEFVFNGFNFKVIKPKLYMEHVSDFYTWFALTEVDAND